MIGGLLAAWAGHTPASRQDADDIICALGDCGIAQKAAAIDMGIAPEKFSRQLAGLEPLNAWRLGYLPVEFHIALLRRRAARVGAVVLTAEERAFILSAAQIGIKRMSKVAPSLFHRKASA